MSRLHNLLAMFWLFDGQTRVKATETREPEPPPPPPPPPPVRVPRDPGRVRLKSDGTPTRHQRRVDARKRREAERVIPKEALAAKRLFTKALWVRSPYRFVKKKAA